MFRTRTVFVIASLLSLMLLSSAAWAIRINTIFYSSTPDTFRWVFDWDRTLPPQGELWTPFGLRELA
jgi:hypothetical protein